MSYHPPYHNDGFFNRKGATYVSVNPPVPSPASAQSFIYPPRPILAPWSRLSHGAPAPVRAPGFVDPLVAVANFSNLQSNGSFGGASSMPWNQIPHTVHEAINSDPTAQLAAEQQYLLAEARSRQKQPVHRGYQQRPALAGAWAPQRVRTVDSLELVPPVQTASHSAPVFQQAPPAHEAQTHSRQRLDPYLGLDLDLDFLDLDPSDLELELDLDFDFDLELDLDLDHGQELVSKTPIQSQGLQQHHHAFEHAVLQQPTQRHVTALVALPAPQVQAPASVAAQEAAPAKAPRVVSHDACKTCRKRRLKCVRQTGEDGKEMFGQPCLRCVAGGVAHECVPHPDGRRSENKPADKKMKKSSKPRRAASGATAPAPATAPSQQPLPDNFSQLTSGHRRSQVQTEEDEIVVASASASASAPQHQQQQQELIDLTSSSEEDVAAEQSSHSTPPDPASFTDDDVNDVLSPFTTPELQHSSAAEMMDHMEAEVDDDAFILFPDLRNIHEWNGSQ